MPELPEVETVTNGIRPFLEGKVIIEVKVLRPQLRIKIPANFKKLTEKTKILKVYRRAKYILIELDNAYTIIIHLGMSGKLTVNERSLTVNEGSLFKNFQMQGLRSDEDRSLLSINEDLRNERNAAVGDLWTSSKHDHLYIKLKSGDAVLYNDTRKFGLVTITETSQLEEHKLIKKLGLEPLDKSFTKKVFYELIQKRNKSIKSVIMDAGIVVGIGNIYACEALFQAGIHPEKLASKLQQKESDLLYSAIVKTLKRAIKAGGSTLKDYAKADGEAGYFQHEFLVYGQENKACTKCKKKIIRIKQNGRSSFVCLKCQKS